MILKKRKIICTLVLIGILLIIIPTSFATDTSNLSIGNNHDIATNTTITEYNNEGDVYTLNENTNSFKLNQNNNLNNPDQISTYASTNGAGTFTDLNTAINSANGNEINLTRNYTYNSTADVNFKDGITINCDLTINGAGYTINGSDTARIFYITGDNTIVTINNLTLTNGNTTKNGGAIYAQSNVNINVSVSIFTGNKAGYGGAIYSYGNLNVNGSNFTGNNANLGGGGAISAENVNVTGSNFTDNNASNGGAIYENSGDGNLNVTGSNFTSNHAKSDAGAICSWNGNVNITNSNFRDNNAGREGGAIKARYMNITNSNFTDNTATNHGGAIEARDMNVTGSSFIGNNANYGGAIDSYECEVIVNDSNFTSNNASYGGAIYTQYGTVNNSIFKDNNANEHGGAILAYGNLNVKGSIFTSNNAKRDAGVIWAGNVDVSGSNFIGNNAKYGDGGAIRANNDVNVSGSNFIGNNAKYGDGGAIYAYNWNAINVNVSGSNFTGNNATLGGAIYVSDVGGSVDGSNFTGNSADNGSAIYVDVITGTFNISNSNFTSNLVGTTSNISDNGTFVSGVLNKGNNVLDAIYNNDEASKLVIDGTSQSIQSTLLSNQDVSIVINGVFKGNQRTDENGTFTFDAGYGFLTINVNCAESNLYKLNQTITISNFMETSITNDYLVTQVNGSVSINVISPNSTVTSGRVDLRKGGTLITSSELVGGTATLSIVGLDSGNYTVIIYYLGNDEYAGSSKFLNLEILPNKVQIPTLLTGIDFNESYNANKTFNISLTDTNGNKLTNQTIKMQLINKAGEITNYTTITDEKGLGRLVIDLGAGEYTIVYSFNGTGVYTSSIGNNTITVNRNKVNVTASLYNSTAGGNFTVKLLDEFANPIVGAEVKLTLFNQLGDFKVYWSTTNTEGVAKLPINLISANWTIETSYPNSDYDLEPVNQTVIVQPSNTTAILSPDKYNETYGANKNFTISFKTSEGISIVGKELPLTLFNELGDFNVYWSTTNTDGVAKLPINLIPGNWIIESAYTGEDYIVSSVNQTVTVTDLAV